MSTHLSAASRDSHLALRRVERQQRLVELLLAAEERLSFPELARELGVSERTIARDVDRLRYSEVPVDVAPGRYGGVRLRTHGRPDPIAFEVSEIAAMISSLTALGPTATDSAASAMAKLTAALHLGEREQPRALR